MIAWLTGSLWIRALLTAGVLAFLASRLDLGAVLAAVTRLDARAALLVLVLLAVDRAVMVWRWLVLLRAADTPVSPASTVRIYLVSSFVGSFLPAGVGGDAARAFSLARRTARGSAAVASVAVDRLLGLLSIVFLAVVGLLVAGRNQLAGMQGVLLSAGTLVLLGLTAFLWADRWMRRLVTHRKLLALADALAAYRGHRRALAVVLLLSILVQLLRILQAWILGRGIGITVPFGYYLLFMPVGLVALMLPISVNGFGLPQGVIVWLLQPAGVPASDAFALSTLIVISGIVANLPGAWLYLRAPPPDMSERT